MIDFRYHLVSLAAVFIALAVGIVLGAGPLREGLSSTLESEVGQLREERTALRNEVDFANQRAEARGRALEQLAAPALDGTLEDVRVGVVVLPGADRNALDQLERQIDRAGGDVVLTTEVSDTGWDAAADDDLLARLADTLEVPDSSDGSQAAAAAVLAAVLAGADRPGQLGAWIAAAAELESEGLVEFAWRGGTVEEFTDRRPPDALVVVSGGLDAAAIEEPEGQQALAARLDLVSALAALEVPVVVTGAGTEAPPTDEEDPLDPLVAAVRDDRALADQVSTVDNLEHVSGQLAAALALAWELREESGHHGLGRLAEGSLPPVPPARTAGVGVPVPEGEPQQGEPGPDTQDGSGVDAQDGGGGPPDGAADPAPTTAAP